MANYWAAMQTNDFKATGEFLHDDYLLDWPQSGERIRGRANAALFCESWPLLGYAGVFFLAAHLFVVWYEEPMLRRTFGGEYEAYCSRVRRWLPSPGKTL